MGLFAFVLSLGFIACNSSSDQIRSTADSNVANISVTSPSPSGTSTPMEGVSHGGAMKSSLGAASAPFDLQFIDTMSEHHRSAIEMAKIAKEKAQHSELKAFAGRIIDAQQKENEQMQAWRDQWYAGKPPAINMEMSGMQGSMMDMDKLRAATGSQFDLMFIEMMTPHHAGAIQMAKDALARAEHTEIKNLARRVALDQQVEIEQMRKWAKEYK
jgi:uncharacterized protein (DUF305 family)